MRQDQTPDWRWVRAQHLSDHDLSPRKSVDDHHVRRAYAFIRKLQRLDPVVEESLRRSHSDLYEAHRIWQADRSGLRWIFEAGVVAGEPTESLADYLHASLDVLKVYEIMFFDVRDALDRPGCVVANLLMPFAQQSVTSRNPDVYWKMLAYNGGWEVVKTCWETGRAPNEAYAFLAKATRQRSMRNAFDAVHTVAANPFNAIDLARVAMDQTRQDHELDTAESTDQMKQALSSLFASISLRVPTNHENVPAEEPRLQSLPQGAMMRDVELPGVDNDRGP